MDGAENNSREGMGEKADGIENSLGTKGVGTRTGSGGLLTCVSDDSYT
jgi:hypothetical protein